VRSILGLAIADKKSRGGESRRFCGFPLHSLVTYLKKATANNLTVVVIDQVGNEIGNKTKLKKRAVVRVVSPGTIFDEFSYNNFIMSVCIRENSGGGEPSVGIAWADVSTGEFYVSGIYVTHYYSRINT
jgi:DNA mismatch repair ATPase MutS